jgi:hypothetical protein
MSQAGSPFLAQFRPSYSAAPPSIVFSCRKIQLAVCFLMERAVVNGGDGLRFLLADYFRNQVMRTLELVQDLLHFFSFFIFIFLFLNFKSLLQTAPPGLQTIPPGSILFRSKPGFPHHGRI